MAQDYTEWLAINVLNEQQLVSYRSLSRALKIHSNLAKQMLYDFHRKQNAKKPGAVHATYLITGTKRKEIPTNVTHSQRDGDDTVMHSSPPLPSSSAPKPDEHDEEPIAVQTVMLVKEENVSQAKRKFESITGIHIYSLQAKGLGDIQTLTECNRKIAADYASEDPLEVWKQYGTIQNPNVKRRTQRRQPPPPPAPIAKEAVAKATPAAPTTKPTTLKKEASKDSQDSKPASKPSSAKATPEPAKKPPTTKRQGSDIFKSFAKGKSKAKAAQESQESAGSTPKAAPEDEPMASFSDEDDADEGDVDVVEDVSKVVDGKSKKEREAELQAMMEQEDEVMEDAAEVTSEQAEAVVHEGAIDKQESQAAEEPKETVQVENGRRRGRRRVMKKKTVKDEDGYLVTKEEAAWESFSEDEPAPKKIKVPPTTGMNKPTTAAAGKKGAKPGQGNIMSFFSKK
ncbi:hypothetical protein B0A55_08478 [Friedmanniomyces simplex]|uniref:DNA polymerase delta subunit 3 n=1 Tax=Friedmanniomyces simplex TaxID=329884 RepID=A0A4V5NHI4_9PEZI|nr:hypothetical protein B0A55_11052 [Friedmanniomyces simplex]TKA69959.1 hypothetical protein B0A55_08478 [Friedmanniomyces simplex]